MGRRLKKVNMYFGNEERCVEVSLDNIEGKLRFVAATGPLGVMSVSFSEPALFCFSSR